jgi:hypothetical protein
MREFFNLLARKGLTARKLDEKLSKWNSGKLRDFIAEAQTILNDVKPTSGQGYSFVSNTPLSGGKFPCIDVECRLSHLDQLARFAALYADRVLIHDPLENYDPDSPEGFGRRLADDLRVLYSVRPLLEQGRISLARTAWHFCEEHYDELLVRSKLQERLERARKALARRFRKDAQVSLEDSNGIPLFKITGSHELIEHGLSYHASAKARSLAERRPDRINQLLSSHEIGASRVFQGHISTVIGDIFVQNLYAKMGFNYLTDRPVDFEVIGAVNDSKTNKRSKAILDGLSHTVPFIQDVGLEKLIKLREDEGASFQIYRDSLNELLKQLDDADLSNPKLVKEAFNDSIRPELHKIDLTVKNSKKLLYGSVKRDVAFGAGFIALGLFSGLLPPGIGQLVAALGGYKFASGVADKAVRALTEPDEARENKYYFLWKLQQGSKPSVLSQLDRTFV